VNLPTTGQRPVPRKKLEKATAILQNVLRFVVVESGKTKRVLRHVANAAETRGKAVNKTVLLEWATDERAHAFSFAPVESRLS